MEWPMTKGITKKEPNPRLVYADIIDHPHWQSPTRPHMSLYDRAAQFSPFAALSGYEDMVSEEARVVDNKKDLSENEKEQLNQKLNALQSKLMDGKSPSVSITYFLPDPLKDGGSYETVTGTVKKIDGIAKQIILTRAAVHGNHAINLEDILEIC